MRVVVRRSCAESEPGRVVSVCDAVAKGPPPAAERSRTRGMWREGRRCDGRGRVDALHVVCGVGESGTSPFLQGEVA